MRVVEKESFYWNFDEEHCFNNVYHFLNYLYEHAEADGELESACLEAMNALYVVAEFCEGVED
jgi:hypothetical protein